MPIFPLEVLAPQIETYLASAHIAYMDAGGMHYRSQEQLDRAGERRVKGSFAILVMHASRRPCMRYQRLDTFQSGREYFPRKYRHLARA